jgi:hypothetical protein
VQGRCWNLTKGLWTVRSCAPGTDRHDRSAAMRIPRVSCDPAIRIQTVKSLLTVGLALLLTACQTERITTTTEGGVSHTRTQPVAAPATPAGAKANKMAFFVGQKPDDSNGNGYPDLISITVLLFSTPHPTAILQPGQFMFTLYPQGTINDPGVKPLGMWRIDGPRVQAAQAVTLGGPCYQFQLSMLDPQAGFKTDRLPLDQADLVCEFLPADGSPPVQCDGVRTIQIGKRVTTEAANH